VEPNQRGAKDGGAGGDNLADEVRAKADLPNAGKLMPTMLPDAGPFVRLAQPGNPGIPATGRPNEIPARMTQKSPRCDYQHRHAEITRVWARKITVLMLP
jgi:hypothetical protein